MRAFSLVAAAAFVMLSPVLAEARPYAIDKAQSRLGFSASMDGDAFQGSFRRWDATIDFDPNNLPASKATVSVDMTSASTGEETRDEALPSSDWFSAAKFPRATFVTRSITRTAPNRYNAAGDLTIRGVKKAVVLPFALTLTGRTAKMTGQLTLDRSAFGIGQGQFRSADSVPLQVVVNVNVTATAQ